MRKIIYILMSLILMCVVVADPSFYFKAGENINLKVPCIDNGMSCSSNTTCKLSVTYPNMTALITNQAMNFGQPFQAYPVGTLETLGQYESTVICNDTNTSGVSMFTFQVLSSNTNFGNDSPLDAVVLVIIGSLGLILFIIFEFKKNIVVGYSSATISLIMAVLVWTQGINIRLTEYTTLLYYKVPSLISGGVGFVLVLLSIWLYYQSSYDDDERDEARDNFDFDLD